VTTASQRALQALSHQQPDRTPLFELFAPYHPIHWDICGRNVATDNAMAWDAMADGIAPDELLQAEIEAEYAIRKFFGLDMVRLNGWPGRDYVRPVKVAEGRWTRNGVAYCVNERTKLVELESPAQAMSDSRRQSEDALRKRVEDWDGTTPAIADEPDPLLEGVKKLAARDGVDWLYMGECGTTTGVAFYPPFLLMWMVTEPELYRRWCAMQEGYGLARIGQLIRAGCSVIATGGDVSCDKGPFISPALYREFVLPALRKCVDLIHAGGAKAVYTSDGNHWPIRDDFFFNSAIDGYKEVDKAAGMTWPRLIEEGVADRICIIGNIDARHTLCLGSPADVRAEVIECLGYGRRTRGGHILHASHSCHEDVKIANYYALVSAYREFFGMEKLPLQPRAL
jgi:hypothetical protein